LGPTAPFLFPHLSLLSALASFSTFPLHEEGLSPSSLKFGWDFFFISPFRSHTIKIGNCLFLCFWISFHKKLVVLISLPSPNSRNNATSLWLLVGIDFCSSLPFSPPPHFLSRWDETPPFMIPLKLQRFDKIPDLSGLLFSGLFSLLSRARVNALPTTIRMVPPAPPQIHPTKRSC